MKRLAMMVIVLFSIKSSVAQFENTETGARATGLNGAFTSLSNNSLAVFYNPSGLGQLKFREISFYYGPEIFGVSGLSQAALSYAEPTGFGVFGAGVKTFGFELYRELTFILSYGNVVNEKVFLGVSANYYQLSIKNYNSASAFGIDAGAMAYFTDFMKWGFTAKNLSGSTIGISKEKIPQVYRTGFTFQPLSELLMILEAEKDVKYPLTFRTGFEYSVYDIADLRTGISTEPVSFSAGIGLNYRMFQIDYTVNNHQELGISHHGSVSINFGGSDSKKFYRDQLKNAFR
ncbi:MAG TPA: hypothetical protein PK536_07140 [Ignavibacteria bacterium]|nr:hypothetical protein [Ignavibacteria bacterium]HRJ99659.1 hypothetical protein [Ignavibacteria bacterium]